MELVSLIRNELDQWGPAVIFAYAEWKILLREIKHPKSFEFQFRRNKSFSSSFLNRPFLGIKLCSEKKNQLVKSYMLIGRLYIHKCWPPYRTETRV